MRKRQTISFGVSSNTLSYDKLGSKVSSAEMNKVYLYHQVMNVKQPYNPYTGKTNRLRALFIYTYLIVPYHQLTQFLLLLYRHMLPRLNNPKQLVMFGLLDSSNADSDIHTWISNCLKNQFLI